MDNIAGGPILQFLHRFAEILQDLTIDKLDLARSTQSTHKPRNRVDDGSQFVF